MSHVPRSGAMATALIYAAFGGLWILLSDKAVEMMFHDPETMVIVSMLKGWLFIGVTALLLYYMLRRGAPPAAGLGTAGTAGTLASRLPALMLALAILLLAGFGIAHNFRQQEQQEVTRLKAVVELKVRMITDWLGERRHDAEFIQSSAYYASQFRSWAKGDAKAGQALQQRLEQFQARRGFAMILLVDPSGHLVWGSDGGKHELAPSLRQGVAAASASRRIQRVGPYGDEAGGRHFDFVVPLATNDTPPPLVVLHADLDAWLYPTMQEWPLPSASGESLLFRRQGDRIVFLNELRYRPGSALHLSLPVTSPDLIAARVLRGEVADGAAVSGVDYRGVPVLGVARAVPDTDWFLVAKLDRAELQAEAISDALWIGFASLLALFLVAVGLALRDQRNRLALVEATRQAQDERLNALQLLEAVAAGSDDAIFAQDLDGRFTLFSRACERITGKTAAEALGHDESIMFPPDVAARQIAANRRVIERGENEVVEEAVPLAAGGHAVFLTTKGPLRDAQGRIIGMFGISRNITQRKRAEEELRARNAELERFNLASVGRELDMVELKKRINALECELGRTPPFPLSFEGAAGDPPSR